MKTETQTAAPFKWCDDEFKTVEETCHAIQESIADQLCNADAGSVWRGEDDPEIYHLEIVVHLLDDKGNRIPRGKATS